MFEIFINAVHHIFVTYDTLKINKVKVLKYYVQCGMYFGKLRNILL